MDQRKKLLIGAAALVVLVGAAAAAYAILSESYEQPEAPVRTQAAATERPEIEAPDFTVYDSSGVQVRLSELRGKPVLLNFWATWCGPCESELPAFNAAYEEHGDEVGFMMVNLAEPGGERPEAVAEYAAENGYTFPIYYDSDGDAASVYGVYSIPMSVFIDEDGIVQAVYPGAMSADTLNKYIDAMLVQ